jgi:branched-chain amino acid transport system permease protein
MFGLIWVAVLLGVAALSNLLDSREGRAIRALKGGIVMAEAMGVDTARMRIVIFVIAAVLACRAGCTPTCSASSILALRAAHRHRVPVHGGGRRRQPCVGRAGLHLIVVLKEWLQDILPVVLGRSGNFETIVFGLLIVVLLQRSRDGLWPYLARLVPVRSRRLEIDPHAEALPRRPMPRRRRWCWTCGT